MRIRIPKYKVELALDQALDKALDKALDTATDLQLEGGGAKEGDLTASFVVTTR